MQEWSSKGQWKYCPTNKEKSYSDWNKITMGTQASGSGTPAHVSFMHNWYVLAGIQLESLALH